MTWICGTLTMLLGVQVDDARDRLESLLDVIGNILEGAQVRPVDPDDDGVARAREHFPDALLEVGLDVAP